MSANKPSDAIPEVMKRRIKELEREGYNEDFLRCFRNAIRDLTDFDRYAHANRVQAQEIGELRARLAEAEARADRDVIERNRVIAEKSARLAEAEAVAARMRRGNRRPV